MKKNRIWAQISETVLAIALSTELGSSEETGAVKTAARLHNADVSDIEAKVLTAREKIEVEAQKAKPAPVVAETPAPVSSEPSIEDLAAAAAAEVDARLEGEEVPA